MVNMQSSWMIVQRIYRRIDETELGLIAAGVAFFGFLALFPVLAVVIAIWGFASDPGVIRGQLALAQDYLPEQSFQLLATQVEALLAVNDNHLGWTTAFSLALALWSARAGVAALIRGLNAIHHLPHRQEHWHQLRAMLVTIVMVALGLVAILAAIVGPVMLNFLPLGRFAAGALEITQLLLGLLVVSLAIGLAYRLGVHRPESPPPFFTMGLLVAVVVWVAVSRGFVIYLANFNAYNQVYGAIGAVAALMMWMYLSAYAVLLGAAVDAARAQPDQ